MLSVDPSAAVGLRVESTCTCWKKDRITRSCASHTTCVAWLAKSLSFFLFVHQAFWACSRIFFYNRSVVSRNKVNLFKCLGQSSCYERTDHAFVLLIINLFCLWFFQLWETLITVSLSVDHLNSEICTICRASFSATPSRHLSRKQFTKKDSGSRLYRHGVSWLSFIGVVTSVACAFYVRFSLL